MAELENIDNRIDEMAELVVELLRKKDLTITTAESLTGGLVSAAITAIPGASEIFKVGVVTYSNKAKRRLLSIKKDLIKKEGAISASVAKEMAIGAMMQSESDIAVSCTGNAGPDTMEGKPVGQVYIGVYAKGKTRVSEQLFEGDRQEVRKQTVLSALTLVRQTVEDKFS